jgi:O-antigen/teichoic acid export membrane protein
MQMIDFRNICVAAIVNVILIVSLIPRFGISGAALGNVAAELTILVLTYRATKHVIGHQPLALHILKTLSCCAVMALFICATPMIHSVYLKSMLAGLIYLGAMLATGIVSPIEVISLLQSLRPSKTSAADRVVLEEFEALPQVALAKAKKGAASTLDSEREFVRQK